MTKYFIEKNEMHDTYDSAARAINILMTYDMSNELYKVLIALEKDIRNKKYIRVGAI
jgi:hypothetical protein